MMESASSVESLRVNKPLSVCFQFCDDDHIPKTKNDVKIVLKALKSFSNPQLLNGRRPHDLDSGGKSEYVKLLNQRHKQKLLSIDAGKAHSQQGDKRIIYFLDPNNNNIAKILTLFFNDHSKK